MRKYLLAALAALAAALPADSDASLRGIYRLKSKDGRHTYTKNPHGFSVEGLLDLKAECGEERYWVTLAYEKLSKCGGPLVSIEGTRIGESEFIIGLYFQDAYDAFVRAAEENFGADAKISKEK